jgi:hypothetical protein
MGRTKLIETPEKLWELFIEYKNDVKSNPRVKHVFVGKDGNSDYERLERPLTMEGFECFVYDKGLNSELSHYFANYEGRYSDYVAICTRVKNSIRHDQIEGGMVGQYNTSITQRLNGLTDKQEIKTIQEQPLFPE